MALSVVRKLPYFRPFQPDIQILSALAALYWPSTSFYWPSTTKYQPVPPSTDPVPSYINQYRSILTQHHHYQQLPTSTDPVPSYINHYALYWPIPTKYLPEPPLIFLFATHLSSIFILPRFSSPSQQIYLPSSKIFLLFLQFQLFDLPLSTWNEQSCTLVYFYCVFVNKILTEMGKVFFWNHGRRKLTPSVCQIYKQYWKSFFLSLVVVWRLW